MPHFDFVHHLYCALPSDGTISGIPTTRSCGWWGTQDGFMRVWWWTSVVLINILLLINIIAEGQDEIENRWTNASFWQLNVMAVVFSAFAGALWFIWLPALYYLSFAVVPALAVAGLGYLGVRLNAWMDIIEQRRIEVEKAKEAELVRLETQADKIILASERENG